MFVFCFCFPCAFCSPTEAKSQWFSSCLFFLFSPQFLTWTYNNGFGESSLQILMLAMKLKMWALGQIQFQCQFLVNSTDWNGIGHARCKFWSSVCCFMGNWCRYSSYSQLFLCSLLHWADNLQILFRQVDESQIIDIMVSEMRILEGVLSCCSIMLTKLVM